MEAPSLEEIKARLKAHPSVTNAEVELHAQKVREIIEIKNKHNIILLGHNYMEPLVFECSEETERGDSYALSAYAAKTDAKIIVFNGVRFMAETAKILNPEKKILMADKTAGCSLADNFTGEDVRKLKEKHPGAPVMIYINSYADAKAESDVVCTSANAAKIAKKLPGKQVIFVPDILFAQNLAEELKGEKEVIYPEESRGAICEVHEKFTLEDINSVRESFEIPKGSPEGRVYAHWECRPEVLREADFYGSTSQIRKDIAERAAKGKLRRAFIASECELTSNLAAEFPQVQFYTACSVRCSHMAKITIEKLYRVMKAIDNNEDLNEWEVTLSDEIIRKAKKPIERMLELGK